jgi:hypothetical protein
VIDPARSPTQQAITIHATDLRPRPNKLLDERERKRDKRET